MTDLDRLTEALAGRYTIERELGAGGMATVYLAHDVRHDRKVALKVLRPELAAVIGADRFLTEIKTTANLQHPHILPLFDSGEADSFLFYVMPYVEGESLRDRLEREKQLPVNDAVRLAGEVASALDYAHRNGIIHRDIKPENILLHDGRAQVADFGIALAASKAGGTRLTETGMSLGTPHYMSPEQAMGERELDARSDVYALGCVLYEMLAGEPPFTGPTAQAIVAKVMTAKPEPVTSYRNTVPHHVASAINTALQKLPADRFATAAEMADTLAGARTVAAAPATATRRPGRVGLLATAGLAAAALAGGWFLGRSGGGSSSDSPLPPSHLAIPVPRLGGSGGAAEDRQLSITADGSTLVYVIESEGAGNTILQRRLGELTAVAVPGVEGRFSPALSPDGRYVMTSGQPGERRRLRLVPLDGGAQMPVRLTNFNYNATPRPVWHPDGSIWFTELADGTISRWDTARDSSEVMLRGTGGLMLNQILPGGTEGLAVRSPVGVNSGNLEQVNLRTGETRVAVSFAIVEARYALGYLVYVMPDGTLQAAAYDTETARTTGPPTTLAAGVSLTGGGVAQFEVAANGTIVYIPEDPRELVLVDRNGLVRQATARLENYHSPVFSPNGMRIAFDFTSINGRDVWMLDLDQAVMTRVTTVRDGHDPTWSHDGRFIHFTSNHSGTFGIYRARAGAGGAGAELLVSDGRLGFTGYQLADGTILTVATGFSPGSGNDLARISAGDSPEVIPAVASPFPDQFPAPSPDGRWLAYVSNLSGEREVYLKPLTGEGEQIQVSAGGGTEPAWHPSGRELFYRHEAGEGTVMMAVGIETQPSLRVTSRTELFPVDRMAAANPHRNYDVSPDGNRFVMIRRSPATRIMVIQGLPELMKQGTSSESR